MHSFLVVGNSAEEIEKETGQIVSSTKSQKVNFELTKIDDVRELSKFVKLKLNQPTAVIIKNIDIATTETLNAFLKNLEEPQESLIYILTASSENKVLPTILSRCQIIKVKNQESRIKNKKEIQKFIKSSTGEKLAIIDKIKKRDEAISFNHNLIIALHNNLNSSPKDYQKTAQNLKTAQKTHLALSQNGNVPLHLANLVINLF